MIRDNEKKYYADSDELWQYDEVKLLPSKSAKLGAQGSDYYISYLNNEGNDVQKLIWEESIDCGNRLFFERWVIVFNLNLQFALFIYENGRRLY